MTIKNIHSGKPLGTAITYFDSQNAVLRVLIADDGVSIRASLAENPLYAGGFCHYTDKSILFTILKFCSKKNNTYLCAMRVIAIGILRDFWTEHADAEGALKEWYLAAGRAQWNSFPDLKTDFGSADYVGNQKVVFNIKGNRYRIVAAVKYKPKLVYIRFVGTHTEYDKIDVKNI